MKRKEEQALGRRPKEGSFVFVRFLQPLNPQGMARLVASLKPFNFST